MARVTIEDCLDHVDNRFALIVLATKRTKQLLEGADPYIKADNKESVVALREIAAGNVVFKHDVKEMLNIKPKS